jgi:hypothetical protein
MGSDGVVGIRAMCANGTGRRKESWKGARLLLNSPGAPGTFIGNAEDGGATGPGKIASAGTAE